MENSIRKFISINTYVKMLAQSNYKYIPTSTLTTSTIFSSTHSSISIYPLIMFNNKECLNSYKNDNRYVYNKENDENEDNFDLQIPPQNDEELKKYYNNRICNNDRIYIFEDIKRKLIFYTPIELLNKIDINKEVSIEICLLFVSMFSMTILKYKNNEEYKINLNSEILHKNYGNNYKKIIDVLKYNNIIESDDYYKKNEKSYTFWLTDKYITKNIRSYKLTTDKVKSIRIKQMTMALSKAMENIISKNTLLMYLRVSLPSDNEILTQGKKLVKERYTRKGITYKILGKKKRVREVGKRYIEDDIELFHILVDPAYIIPISSENAGGRVVNSFNLMPNWIRKMVKIDGEEIVECDYSALHPNIASMLYGDGRYISHQMIADDLNIDRSIVKIEHLSFFNKPFHSMKRSILWDYYMKNKSSMIENLLKDRGENGSKNNEHKHTSLTFFRIEVKMMTEVMRILSNEGIYPMYVYDALYDTKNNSKRIKEVMLEVSNRFNIPAEVKLDDLTNDNLKDDKLIDNDIKVDKNEEFEVIRYKGFKDVKVEKITKEVKKKFLNLINELIKNDIEPSEDILVDINMFSKELTSYLYEKWRISNNYKEIKIEN